MVRPMRGSMVVLKKGDDGVRLTIFKNTVYLETAPDTTSLQASKFAGDEEESRAYYNQQMIALRQLGFKQVQLSNNVKSFEAFPWSQFEEADPSDNALAKSAIAPHKEGAMWITSWSEAELELTELSTWIREAAPRALLAKRLPDEVLPDLGESLRELILDHPLTTMAKSTRRKHLELTQVLDYCPELEKLFVIGRFIMAIELESKHLRSLSLASDPMSNNTLSMLLESKLPALEELNLGCACESKPIDNAAEDIARLITLESYSSLKSLGLFCPPEDDALLNVLFSDEHSISCITLSGFEPSESLLEKAQAWVGAKSERSVVFDDVTLGQAIDVSARLFSPASYGFEERFAQLREKSADA